MRISPWQRYARPAAELLAVVWLRVRTQANKASYACFFMPQKHKTRYHPLYYSTASSSAALWVQAVPFWWPCTRRHPEECVLRRPGPLPLSCNVGLRKGAHCPRCCTQSSSTLCYESVVMVIGKQSVRARLDAPKLSHGGGVRAVCPPRPQSSTWSFAESRKEAGPLSKQLVQPTAGRHCVSGFRSCAANT